MNHMGNLDMLPEAAAPEQESDLERHRRYYAQFNIKDVDLLRLELSDVETLEPDNSEKISAIRERIVALEKLASADSPDDQKSEPLATETPSVESEAPLKAGDAPKVERAEISDIHKQIEEALVDLDKLPERLPDSLKSLITRAKQKLKELLDEVRRGQAEQVASEPEVWQLFLVIDNLKLRNAIGDDEQTINHLSESYLNLVEVNDDGDGLKLETRATALANIALFKSPETALTIFELLQEKINLPKGAKQKFLKEIESGWREAVDTILRGLQKHLKLDPETQRHFDAAAAEILSQIKPDMDLASYLKAAKLYFNTLTDPEIQPEEPAIQPESAAEVRNQEKENEALLAALEMIVQHAEQRTGSRDSETGITDTEAEGEEMILDIDPASEIVEERPETSPADLASPEVAPVSEAAPAAPEMPEGSPETAKVGKYSDTWIAEQLDRFGISMEQWEGLKDLERLSAGQKAQLVENFKQLMLGRIEESAYERYGQNVAQANFVGRLWKSMFKNYYLAREKQTSLKDLENPDFDDEGLKMMMLQKLVEGYYSFSPDVEIIDGRLATHYVNPKHFGGVEALQHAEIEIIEQFNSTALEFENLPYEWSLATASREQRKKYQEVKVRYEAIKGELLNLKERTTGGGELYLNGIEEKIRLGQLLTANPEIEQELENIKSSKLWLKTLRSTFTERGLYMLGGTASRAAGMYALGFMGAPLAAAGIGGFAAFRRSRESLREQDKFARRGIEAPKLKSDIKAENEFHLVSHEYYKLLEQEPEFVPSFQPIEKPDYIFETDSEEIRKEKATAWEQYNDEQKRINEELETFRTQSAEYYRSLSNFKKRYEAARDEMIDRGRMARNVQAVTREIGPKVLEVWHNLADGEEAPEGAEVRVDQVSGNRQFKEITTEKGVEVIQAGLAAKLDRAIERLEAAEASESDEEKSSVNISEYLKRIESLQERIQYTQLKLDQGLIDFGQSSDRLKNHYDLIQSLSRAKIVLAEVDPAVLVREETRELRDIPKYRIGMYLERKMKNTDKKRRAYIIKQTLKGAGLSAGFATAGYFIAQSVGLGGGGHRVDHSHATPGSVPGGSGADTAQTDFGSGTAEAGIVEHNGTPFDSSSADSGGVAAGADTAGMQFETAPVDSTMPDVAPDSSQIDTAGAEHVAQSGVAEKLADGDFSEVARKGDTVWEMAERQLTEHFGDKFKSLGEAEKTLIIDGIKDKVLANPQDFGFANGADPSHLHVGQELDFSSVMKNHTLLDRLFEDAGGLSPAAVENIVHHNAIINDWLINHPGEPLTSDNVDMIVQGTYRLGVTEEVLAKISAEAGSDALTMQEYTNLLLFGHQQGHDAVEAAARAAVEATLHQGVDPLADIPPENNLLSKMVEHGWSETTEGHRWFAAHTGDVWKQDGEVYTIVRTLARDAGRLMENAKQMAQHQFDDAGLGMHDVEGVIQNVTQDSRRVGQAVVGHVLFKLEK